VNPKPGRKSIKKNGMVDGIKCGSEVKEAEAGDLLFTDGSDDEIVEREKD
jgi:hypothetical protein